MAINCLLLGWKVVQFWLKDYTEEGTSSELQEEVGERGGGERGGAGVGVGV